MTLYAYSIFKKNIDQKKIASLFGDTIFGDTLSVFPFPKIDFGTFQLGIAQLVPRVRGLLGSPPFVHHHLPTPSQTAQKNLDFKREAALPDSANRRNQFSLQRLIFY